MNKTTVDLSLAGRTMKWKFADGPSPNTTYEHVFRADGTVTWRELKGPAKDRPAGEKESHRLPHAEYASEEIAPGVHLVSYLSESGFTLTAAVNLDTNEIVAFASNDKEWYPVHGRVET